MPERITHEEYLRWKADAAKSYLDELPEVSTGALANALEEVYERGFATAVATLEFYGRIIIEKPVKYR